MFKTDRGKSIKDLVKAFDMHAVPVNFQIQNSKTHHETVTGGTVSLVIFLISFLYGIALLNQLFGRKHNII